MMKRETKGSIARFKVVLLAFIDEALNSVQTYIKVFGLFRSTA